MTRGLARQKLVRGGGGVGGRGKGRERCGGGGGVGGIWDTGEGFKAFCDGQPGYGPLTANLTTTVTEVVTHVGLKLVSTSSTQQNNVGLRLKLKVWIWIPTVWFDHQTLLVCVCMQCVACVCVCLRPSLWLPIKQRTTELRCVWSGDSIINGLLF